MYIHKQEICSIFWLFCVFLLSREGAVDPPVIAGVAATRQLLQPDQRHAVRFQLWDSFSGSPAQVETVEAEATLELDIFVGVCVSVPCVTAMLRLSQLLPHITDAAGKAYFGHLGWNDRYEEGGDL